MHPASTSNLPALGRHRNESQEREPSAVSRGAMPRKPWPSIGQRAGQGEATLLRAMRCVLIFRLAIGFGFVALPFLGGTPPDWAGAHAREGR